MWAWSSNSCGWPCSRACSSPPRLLPRRCSGGGSRRTDSAARSSATSAGGWTTPEAVVHLYAPAFFLALATALAMPGQLSWERWLDGNPAGAGSWIAGLLPLAVAIGLRALAPRQYGRGLWESVPWLAEATRTLAGPPQPEPTPAWAGKNRRPLDQAARGPVLAADPTALSAPLFGARCGCRHAAPNRSAVGPAARRGDGQHRRVVGARAGDRAGSRQSCTDVRCAAAIVGSARRTGGWRGCRPSRSARALGGRGRRRPGPEFVIFCGKSQPSH